MDHQEDRTKAISRDDSFTHLFNPSDRLVGLLILHIRPTSGLRELHANALKTFLNNVLFCTIEKQATMWTAENAHQSRFGSIYKGLSFPTLDCLITNLELRKFSPELSYLMFAELERALRDKPLQFECGTVMSDTSDIHFFTRKTSTVNVTLIK